MTLNQVTFAEPYLVLELRWATDEGVHRATRPPGSDISDLPKGVQIWVEEVWTPEVVEKYQKASAPSPVPEESGEPPIDPLQEILGKLTAMEGRLAKVERGGIVTPATK